MKTKRYFMISALVLLACSCRDEEQGGVQPTPGQEVQFGAALEQSESRTIYGDEENNAFPINWINGDEVIVFSPDCASNGGVGSATYKVNVGEANSGKQNYANSLDKTGDIGVRWGDNDTGSFYSIYPASSLYTKVSSDCKTVTLIMPAQQDNDFERTQDGKIKAYPDMRACFMYAYTPDVPSGNTVDLKYKPLSTAIRFTLQGPQNESDNPVTITYVRVYAPDGVSINGTYTFDDVTNGSGIPQAKNGLNYVTMNVADINTGAYLTLAHGESVELNIFLLTGKDIVMTDAWYIEVGTGSGQSYQLSLAAIAGTNDVNRTLKPGMIHRLPTLPPLKSEEWSAANWMKNLQRNVYLSEISIPGSWYSLNSEYQDPAAIDRQYDAGVRAFHLDTRWKGSSSWGNFTPTELGVVDGDAHTDDTGVLGGHKKFLTSAAPSFADALKQITDNVKDDEYMVVMCTFAQGSVVTGDWRQAISNACANNSYVIEASSLSPNTVVGDVLGKVIVIVNTYTEGEVPNSKCLFFNMGITLNQNEFMNNDYYMSPLQWYNITNSGLTMYGTHAQATINSTSESGENDSSRGYMPSFFDRENKAQNILTWSKNNYSNRDNYSHDCWIYLGLGGYIPGGILQDDDCPTVADVLNNWIDSKVKAMETEKSYYPVGIVLMNYANYYSHVVSEILMMNNKYRKAYDPTRSPVDGSYINGTGNAVQSAAPGYSSGLKDNQTDAIGWSRCR